MPILALCLAFHFVRVHSATEDATHFVSHKQSVVSFCQAVPTLGGKPAPSLLGNAIALGQPSLEATEQRHQPKPVLRLLLLRSYRFSRLGYG
jgi:hypothetical protein